MIKRTMLLVFGLIMCVMANAYTCVTFNSGDPSILLQEVTITYEIDWDHARVTNHDNLLFPQYLQSRGADFVADWPNDRAKAEKYFTTRFNKKSDFLKINEEGNSGEYKMVMRIATIDVGNGGSVLTPYSSSKAGGVIIDGTLEFYNRQGQPVCVLNIVEGKGSGYPSETIRYGLALSEIAADIHDFIDDNVKKGKVKATPVTAVAPLASAPTSAASAAAPAASVPSSAVSAPSSAPLSASSGTTAAPASSAAAPSAPLGEARVTLKNGSVIIGQVKAFDPTQSITLFVAGITTTISMNEVQNVESLSNGGLVTGGGKKNDAPRKQSSYSPPVSTNYQETASPILGGRKLTVTDNADYPPYISLNINGQQLRLVLVRGGHLNMGYDGEGSRKLMSEPVHEVAVTSFYISDQPIPADIASQIVRNVEGRGVEPAQFREFSDAQKLVNVIAQKVGKPYRLPTEAEWELAACGEQQGDVFNLNTDMYTYYEWTSDYHDRFSDSRQVLVDPVGPMSGKEHQVRSYNGKLGKFDRSNNVDQKEAYLGLVRLVIKAKDR